MKEMLSHKPAYGAVTTPKAEANGKDSGGLTPHPIGLRCHLNVLQQVPFLWQAGASHCSGLPALMAQGPLF